MGRQPDFATGKPVDLGKPEEQVRQDFERQLVGGYNYPKSHIDIEVRIPRGSGHFKDRADVVVYEGAEKAGRDATRHILGIAECKRPGTTSGVEQLKSYMSATSARWGVWTNGTDITHVCRDPADPARLLDDHLHNMPVFGQAVEDVGKLSKDQLVPYARGDLKIVFRRILNKLYANSQIARRDRLGTEMVKLIFAKIEDEQTYPDRPPEFRVQTGEPVENVARRVKALFARVVEKHSGDDIFDANETIMLDAASVAEVVGQLERCSLTKTDTDAAGDAFEVFAESRLAGEKGQFFTPRGVVRLAVLLADPKPRETICDPACGSGGFLIGAMRHIWAQMDRDPFGEYGTGEHLNNEKRRIAASTLHGIDKEIDLIKIAKAYMAIAGDGRTHICRGDSLASPADGADESGRYDVVLTNPPFGTKSKVRAEQSRGFDLGHKWTRGASGWTKGDSSAERDPYILFIERCVRLAKPGGRIVIVLPESVFHAPSLAYVRNYIRGIGSVEALIDLPHNSFRPHCNAKTCLIMIRKGAAQGSVTMATPQEMGHDLQGKPLHRPGTEEIWDDLAVVEREIADPDNSANQHTFLANADAVSDHCWVPRYHRGLVFPPVVPPDCAGAPLGALVDDGTISAFDGHGSPRASQKGLGPVPYIRVADIVNWELYHNPVARVPESERRRLKAERRPPEVDDVLLVRRGSYRIGTVAIVGPRDLEAVLTSELLTLRVNEPNSRGITAHYLLAMLATATVQEQIPPKVCVDTTLPNLGDRWRSIVVPIHLDPEERNAVARAAEAIVEQKREAWAQTERLGQQIGSLTT